MKVKSNSIYLVVITTFGLLYALYLIVQNPQPFGKIALVAFIIFGSTFLIKHIVLKKILQGVTLIVGLLFSILGTRSLSYNNTNEKLFENATEVQFSNVSFSESLIKAENENKLVFVDFYTVWCAPCIQFHRNVLKNKEVALYMNSAFINTKYDLYKGEGETLKKTYNVSYVPRFLILDTDGNIVEDISTETILTKERMIAISKKYNKL